MFKKLLLAVVAIVVLLVVTVAVLAFAMPTEIKVERDVTINKPTAEVFQYLKSMKNQNEWGPWFKKDPSMKQEFRGTDGTVGFTSAWNSSDDEIGEGEQEIKKITEGERIDSELRFKRPFESKSDAYLITESAGDNQTKVRWGFTGSMPRPLNLMCLVYDIDKEAGKDFEQGLATLKTKLETQPK
jgi:hypothetical protein